MPTTNLEKKSHSGSRGRKSPFDGREHTIPVDFITEPEEARKLHAQFFRIQKDLHVVIIPRCNIVFSHNFEHVVRGILPDNGETGVHINIADLAGSLTMKGLALQGRYKEKDPYDIYLMEVLQKQAYRRGASNAKVSGELRG